MKSEENDALWELLGKADRKPDISPTFAQDVAREARLLGQGTGGFWQKISAFLFPESGGWARPAVAACALTAIAVAASLLFHGGDSPDPAPGPIGGVAESVVPHVEPSVVVDPVLDGFEDELDRLDQFDELMTITNVDDLADEEIAMLLF